MPVMRELNSEEFFAMSSAVTVPTSRQSVRRCPGRTMVFSSAPSSSSVRMLSSEISSSASSFWSGWKMISSSWERM